MMKHIFPTLLVSAMVISACSSTTHTTANNSTKTDSVSAPAGDQSMPKALFATMKIQNNIKMGDSVKLKFTVYNPTDSTQQFCKWHTPFEPLMSKYLDVKAENGEEAAYKGPMAKRIMPPPADSYIKVKAGDSLSVNVDVLKAYALKDPAKYSITYNSEAMSGLVVKDSVVFVYVK